MNKISALIFDDVADDLEEIALNLQSIWDRFLLRNGDRLPALEITRVSSVREMNKILLSGDKKGDLKEYDFFLSDLLVGEGQQDGFTKNGANPELHGYRFLSRAKKLHIKVCVAITHGQGPSHKEFTTSASGFSGSIDLTFFKDDLYGTKGDSSRTIFIEKLVGKLLETRVLQTLTTNLVMADSIQESRTQAILEEIGQSTIDAFAATFALPGSDSYSMRAITPGLSGSKVVLIQYSGRENFSNRSLIIKLNRDQTALDRELAAFNEYVRKPLQAVTRIIADPVDGNIVSIGAWNALAFRCVENAYSLLDWLSSEYATSSNVKTVLKDLYTYNGLKNLYQSARKEAKYPVEQILDDLITPYRKLAIHEAVAELAPLIDRFWTGIPWNRSRIINLIDYGTVGEIQSGNLRWPSYTNICHGDFHARNILVQTLEERPQLCIIDLANMKRSFWATDAIRLAVDLAISGWDNGPESYDWSSINQWSCLLDILGISSNIQVNVNFGKNALVQVALNWLNENFIENHAMPDSKHLSGEYTLALAVELMRASYRKLDLPAPKRAFALIAAAAAIESAEKKFNENRRK